MHTFDLLVHACAPGSLREVHYLVLITAVRNLKPFDKVFLLISIKVSIWINTKPWFDLRAWRGGAGGVGLGGLGWDRRGGMGSGALFGRDAMGEMGSCELGVGWVR